MSPPDGIHDDLPPGLTPEETAALGAMAERLRAATPVPALDFRERLWATLVEPRPAPRRRARAGAHYRGLAAACTSAGTVLLAIAALGVAGSGPFSA